MDGVGFISEYDLPPFTEIHDTHIETDRMPIYGCTINDLLAVITDQSDEMFGGINNEIFELTPSEFNHFVSTPLRLPSNPRDIPVKTMKTIIFERFDSWKALSGRGNLITNKKEE